MILGFAACGDVVPPPAKPDTLEDEATPRPSATKPRPAAVGGLQQIRTDLLDPVPSYHRSSHNIFAFVEPPPPKPPAPPKPTPPPPDTDKDGIPDFRDNCVSVFNPDQLDIDHNGIGAACQEGKETPPPPLPPAFTYKYLGNFGPANRQLATFASGDEVLNVRVGQTFGNQFILRNIGVESVDIGFVGFPPDQTKRIAVGQ
ncbi:MAG TPA: hypothetical protein VHL58_04420 [Thermoanaerobaculia bacterium]|nr:hypothetical protein [Thermoanaerobaculia bacterium]